MTTDLLVELEQKVSHAVELIELLQLHIEDLEAENERLKSDQEKWRYDLHALIKRLDHVSLAQGGQVLRPRTQVRAQTQILETEEDYMTV